jgi:hypothetical protein
MDLPDLVEKYHGALVSDFYHYYNRDLDEWIDDGLSVSLLKDLVEGLPPDSALSRAMNPDSWYWQNIEELLALICEEVNKLHIDFIRANVENANPQPMQIPRPWKKKKVELTGTDLHQLQSKMKRIPRNGN